jgi:hypothetical protein
MPNCFSEQDTPASSQNLAQNHTEIKRAVKDLLLEVSAEPVSHDICLHCGQEMKYIDTTLWFYGEDHSFHVRLPVCGCRALASD